MNAPIENPSGSDAAPISPTQSHSSQGRFRHAIVLGLVGLVASLISFAAIRMTGEVFELPEHLLALTRTIPGKEDQLRVAAGMVVKNYKNYALWIGITGAITGVMFGVALGRIRRSHASLVVGGLGGLILGGAFGAGAGCLANYLGENMITSVRHAKMEVPEQYSMLLHGTTWLIVGLGVGLGTGLGATRNRIGAAIVSMFLCGIAGAAAGAFYPFIASAVLPLVDSSITIPKGELNRIVWLALPSMLMGLVVGRKG